MTALVRSSRFVRRLTAPFRWSVTVLLAWSHRHTLALWFRSYSAAIAGGRASGRDLRRLTVALARIAIDGRFANARSLRRVRVVGDHLDIDIDPDWPMRSALFAVIGHDASSVSDLVAVPERDAPDAVVHA